MSLSVHFTEGVKEGQNIGLDREEAEAQMASAEQIQSVGILIRLYWNETKEFKKFLL